ncbi:MAG: DUF6786 family protein [Bacteroidales bacterium]
MKHAIAIILLPAILLSCGQGNSKKEKTTDTMTKETTGTYKSDKDFLQAHVEIIELARGSSALLLAPGWQGRVMTSTAEGDQGSSFGWINKGLIGSAVKQAHINAFGGEERLWLGPEGGQYSIFFRKGDPFVYDKWQTPSFIDTDPYVIASRTDTSVTFVHECSIENYSGTRFDLGIERKVTLLSENEINRLLGSKPGETKSVAYRSENTLSNNGKLQWEKKSGLLSIWMLGMFTPSPSVVVIIPVKKGDESSLGVIVNDNYFGKIAGDRLKVQGEHILFRADGKSRGKIGIPPLRTNGVMGSYDFGNNVLTLLFCELPEGITDYVNSAWEIQDKPYSGDAFNSYNDGPLEDGSQMGPFYELETSSPGAALKPGEIIKHVQTTIHVKGNNDVMDMISRKILGISLEEVKKQMF